LPWLGHGRSGDSDSGAGIREAVCVGGYRAAVWSLPIDRSPLWSPVQQLPVRVVLGWLRWLDTVHLQRRMEELLVRFFRRLLHLRTWLPGVPARTSEFHRRVTVNGASLPVSGSEGFNYFVLDQQWLVRTDTAACWPLCADQNLGPGDPDAFEVTYLRGKEVPTALAQGTASLACEYAKACIGAPCRLPQRVTSISRQGVTISVADIDSVLRNGLSGLWELDQLIMAINPYGLKGRTRFYSPDLPEPRQVTWP